MMTPQPKRILIADDHDIVRRGLRAVIEQRDDWSVVAEASDGGEALEAALATKPDIAVIDFSLPTMNGLDLTGHIRRELPATEVLIYTMRQRQRRSQRARRRRPWLCPEVGCRPAHRRRDRRACTSQALFHRQRVGNPARALPVEFAFRNRPSDYSG